MEENQNLEATEQVQQEEQQESSKDYNFRLLRERAIKAEQRVAEYEKAQQQAKSSKEDDVDIEEDGYVEGKNFKRYISELKRETRKTREELNNYHSQQAQVTAELRLKAAYPDLDNVINSKNMEKLAQLYPEDYATVMSNPDLYAKGKTFYNMVTRYGISEKHKDAAARIDENLSKPKPSAGSTGYTSDSPLASVKDYDRRVLSPAEKRAVYQQSLQYSRG